MRKTFWVHLKNPVKSEKFQHHPDADRISRRHPFDKIGRIRRLKVFHLCIIVFGSSVDDDFNLIQPSLIQQLRTILDQYPDDGQILKVKKAHTKYMNYIYVCVYS